MLGEGVDPKSLLMEKKSQHAPAEVVRWNPMDFSRFYQHPRWSRFSPDFIQPKTADSRPTNCAFLDSWMLHAWVQHRRWSFLHGTKWLQQTHRLSGTSWWFFTNPPWKDLCKSNWIMKPQASGWKFQKYPPTSGNQHLPKCWLKSTGLICFPSHLNISSHQQIWGLFVFLPNQVTWILYGHTTKFDHFCSKKSNWKKRTWIELVPYTNSLATFEGKGKFQGANHNGHLSWDCVPLTWLPPKRDPPEV